MDRKAEIQGGNKLSLFFFSNQANPRRKRGDFFCWLSPSCTGSAFVIWGIATRRNFNYRYAAWRAIALSAISKGCLASSDKETGTLELLGKNDTWPETILRREATRRDSSFGDAIRKVSGVSAARKNIMAKSRFPLFAREKLAVIDVSWQLTARRSGCCPVYSESSVSLFFGRLVRGRSFKSKTRKANTRTRMRGRGTSAKRRNESACSISSIAFIVEMENCSGRLKLFYCFK